MRNIKLCNMLLTVFFIPMIAVESFSQSISQKVNGFCGGYKTVGNKNVSWTLGEPIAKTLTNGNHSITCGFHQPEIVVKILNLKTYIEGFYAGNGLMQAVLYNDLLSTDPTACDSIIVELHKSIIPFDLIAATNGLVHTNGSTEVRFPSSIKSGNYFLAIRHRNSIETWSKTPVSIGHNNVFDFRY